MRHAYKPIGTGECWTCGQPFFTHADHVKNLKREAAQAVDAACDAQSQAMAEDAYEKVRYARIAQEAY